MQRDSRRTSSREPVTLRPRPAANIETTGHVMPGWLRPVWTSELLLWDACLPIGVHAGSRCQLSSLRGRFCAAPRAASGCAVCSHRRLTRDSSGLAWRVEACSACWQVSEAAVTSQLAAVTCSLVTRVRDLRLDKAKSGDKQVGGGRPVPSGRALERFKAPKQYPKSAPARRAR